MKSFLKKTALLVAIISALSNVNVHAGRGGAIAGGILGGMALGGIISSANNRGRAQDAYEQGRRDAQIEQQYSPDGRYADQASYEYDMAQKKCLRLPMQQRKQCLDRVEKNRPMSVDYMQE
jgi:hypothetical protein